MRVLRSPSPSSPPQESYRVFKIKFIGVPQKKTRTENNPAEVFLRLLLLHILLETFQTYHMLKVFWWIVWGYVTMLTLDSKILRFNVSAILGIPAWKQQKKEIKATTGQWTQHTYSV